jgi:hypothetical protein
MDKPTVIPFDRFRANRPDAVDEQPGLESPLRRELSDRQIAHRRRMLKHLSAATWRVGPTAVERAE